MIVLQKNPNLSVEEIQEKTNLSIDQVRRGIEWLRHKQLVVVNTSKKEYAILGKIDIPNFELPEQKLFEKLKEKNQIPMNELHQFLDKNEFNVAISQLKKNNFIEMIKNANEILISLNKNISANIPSVELFRKISEQNKILKNNIKDLPALENLTQRKLIAIEPEVMKRFILTASGLIQSQKESLQKSKTFSADTILVESSEKRAIDVEATVPETFVARTHPLKDTIDEIREIFVTLGFSEIIGNMTQSSFWNFDALFTPQDHPARELQDTFYLDGISAKKIATPEQIRKVSESHKKNWRYFWDINEARKMVLRTHTTGVTIKHLAENKPDEARIFSLGRVFRNEKVSYKHLVEFNQIEGVVVGKDANLRNLMGIQREFYKRIGITKIKFWPTFFPYTEPSLQTMVYNEKLGKWIELFGMGIFRPEVTKPLGITKPVLAWGGGIERIAMLKYGLDDVREFYNNNLNWLRSATKCQ